jgi:mannose-6-phosphate isomerase-like protein (cupin superfamily)
MRISSLNDCFKGWFVSAFGSAAYKDNFEVAIKRYKAGEYESAHKHMVATEITVIVSGIVHMNEKTYRENDIIVIEPGESTDFRCLTDVITCVVKNKSVDGDKYSV